MEPASFVGVLLVSPAEKEKKKDVNYRYNKGDNGQYCAPKHVEEIGREKGVA